eukprot:TRINITY_DN1804_c0_g1_i10.p1 TRINITY_DN1804_c0_g1~~TRINITY_DN1804_c0_g1_i10.p1  ORF type:complete len:298 (-),score=85.23 TRINITY_DN1804_c0_g1_i10:117-1010(-)
MCQVLLEFYPTLLGHPDSEGATPLHYACLNGNLPIFQFLLEKGATMVKDRNGETPLHLACLNGHVEVVSKLLELGAEPNAKSDDGSTPLHLATVNSQVSVVQLLLSHSGINREIKSHSGKTALQIAQEMGCQEVLDNFNDLKRANLLKVVEMENKYKERKLIKKELEDKIQRDKNKLTEVLREIENVSSLHSKTKLEKERFSELTSTIPVESHDARLQQLKQEIQHHIQTNTKLQQEFEKSQQQQKIDNLMIANATLDTQESLVDLFALMNNVHLAITTVKSQIEGMKPLLKPPSIQ